MSIEQFGCIFFKTDGFQSISRAFQENFGSILQAVLEHFGSILLFFTLELFESIMGALWFVKKNFLVGGW